MALTRSFRDTVRERARRDPEFRLGLLKEAAVALLKGEVGVARIILRDYVSTRLKR